MFWFWWLMTPFIGRNLAETTEELKEKTDDLVIQRCAQLAHEREGIAVMRAVDTAKEMFRSGCYGSSVLDEVRIFELEQRVQLQQQTIRDYQLAFERLSWMADQEER